MAVTIKMNDRGVDLPMQPHERPAFPVFGYSGGMTLREYYAGLALEGILFGKAGEGSNPHYYVHGLSKTISVIYAEDACGFVDALLAELAKPTATPAP